MTATLLLHACCTTDADCDDGIFCNGSEACSAGFCTQGAPPDCDDSIACTTDRCDEESDVCENTADHASCDDAVACTQDLCDPILDCQHTPDHTLCDDAVACTQDLCDPILDCQHPPDHALCDDALFCTIDTCDPVLDCLHSPHPCDDAVFCTVDACDEDADICQHTPDTALCDDGLWCTIDACDPVLGCQYVDRPCDDAVDCTIDTCDHSLDECWHAPDHNACAHLDDICLLGRCDPTEGCIAQPVADGTICGSDMICVDGACVTRTCGDGYVEPLGAEECDDGNDDPGDACSPTCTSTDFQVNTSTAWAEQDPAVALHADGSFTIVFEQESYLSPAWTDLRYRRYDRHGIPMDTDLPLTGTSGMQLDPSIVTLASGGFAVAWAENPSDSDLFGIVLGIFDSTGTELDTVQVNTRTLGSQTSPQLTIDPTGTELLVLWEDDAPTASLGTVAFRRFDTTAAPVDADQVTVPTGTYLFASEPTAAHAPDGTFLVAWTQSPTGSQTDVLVRLYSSSATPLSAPTSVTTPTTDGHEYAPSVAYDASTSRFVVTWEEITHTGSTRIAAVLVDATGAPIHPSGTLIAVPSTPDEEFFSPRIRIAAVPASHHPTPEPGDPTIQSIVYITYVGTASTHTDLPYDLLAHRWSVGADTLTPFDPAALVITTTTTSEQITPALSAGAGAFALAWTDFSREGTDEDYSAVRARLLPLGWVVLP